MTNTNKPDESKPMAEPRGFGKHSRGLAGEYAHEQGWQLNEEERRKSAATEDTQGGADYDYGARDFGDEPVNTAGAASVDEVSKARKSLTKED